MESPRFSRVRIAPWERTLLSHHDPKHGPALEALAGFQLSNYSTLQGEYIWNSNTLYLTSVAIGAGAQQSVIGERASPISRPGEYAIPRSVASCLRSSRLMAVITKSVSNSSRGFFCRQRTSWILPWVAAPPPSS